MRTRKEIKEDKNKYTGTLNVDSWEGKDTNELILEVLLDIRDLLTKDNITGYAEIPTSNLHL